MPISTKKIGTRNAAIGWTSSSKPVFATLDEAAVVHVFQDQSSREGADDRREADGVRQPRKKEAESQTDRQENTARPQSRCQREEPRREPDAEHERSRPGSPTPCR